MDWRSCTSQLEKLDISTTQKANAFNFFSIAIELPAPSEMTVNPYDGSISLHWGRYELAVFEDRYETYQFSDGGTVIHHWPHSPEEVLDDVMVSELKTATSLRLPTQECG